MTSPRIQWPWEKIHDLLKVLCFQTGSWCCLWQCTWLYQDLLLLKILFQVCKKILRYHTGTSTCRWFAVSFFFVCLFPLKSNSFHQIFHKILIICENKNDQCQGVPFFKILSLMIPSTVLGGGNSTLYQKKKKTFILILDQAPFIATQHWVVKFFPALPSFFSRVYTFLKMFF